MVKRLIGSGCRLDGEWSRSRMGVLDGGGDRRREGTVLGRGKYGAFHCRPNQWGLCGIFSAVRGGGVLLWDILSFNCAKSQIRQPTASRLCCGLSMAAVCQLLNLDPGREHHSSLSATLVSEAVSDMLQTKHL